MDTNPNISRLLEMLDNPSAYSEQEIRDIIHSDEETLEAYRSMVAAKQAYRLKQTHKPADVEAAWQRFEKKTPTLPSLLGRGLNVMTLASKPRMDGLGESPLRFGWVKVAATFIAVAFLGALAWAFVPRLLSPKANVPQSAEVTVLPLEGERGGDLLSFTNLRLDSILTVVGNHYGRKVCFRDEAPRELRFTITWNRWQPIASFVSSLNEFDGLLLTDEHDTLFVEAIGTEEE